MFKFFKRSGPSTVTPEVTPAVDEPSETMKERRQFPRPLPRPDVVEGNGGNTDWALWEEAKLEQVKP